MQFGRSFKDNSFEAINDKYIFQVEDKIYLLIKVNLVTRLFPRNIFNENEKLKKAQKRNEVIFITVS